MPKSGLLERPGRGNILVKKREDKMILMRDINEYVFSRKVKIFFSKLGLWELIVNKHISLGPDTTITNKKSRD